MKILEAGLRRGASPFIRWSVSPFLILVMVFFGFIGFASEFTISSKVVLLTLLIEFVLLASLLALWGVPYVGRVVTCAAFFATAFLLFKNVREPSPLGENWHDRPLKILSALGAFFTIGLPCAFYTLRGRFSWRKPSND